MNGVVKCSRASRIGFYVSTHDQSDHSCGIGGCHRKTGAKSSCLQAGKVNEEFIVTFAAKRFSVFFLHRLLHPLPCHRSLNRLRNFPHCRFRLCEIRLSDGEVKN